MRKIVLLIGLLIVLISAAQAENISMLMDDANLLYSSREAVECGEKSVELYGKILEIDPNNYDAAWKAARACKWLGTAYPNEKKMAILEMGENFAKKAVEINTGRAEGHYWLGVNMGRIGEERGVLNSLFMVGPIKDEMEKVLEIEPDNDEATIVLSVLYRKAPGWPLSCGDIDKSLRFAQRAVELRPEKVYNHVAFAKVLMEKGRNKEAADELLFAIEMPFEEDMVPENKIDKEEAKELLKKVNERLGRN